LYNVCVIDIVTMAKRNWLQYKYFSSYYHSDILGNRSELYEAKSLRFTTLVTINNDDILWQPRWQFM